MAYKIAIIPPPWYPLPIQGITSAIELLTEDIAEQLAKDGNDIHVFCFGDKDRDICKHLGITYHYTKHTRTDDVSKIAFQFINRDISNTIFHQKGYAQKIAKKISLYKPDFIHVIQFFPLCFWIKKGNPNTPVFYHCYWHGLGVNFSYFNHGFIRDDTVAQVAQCVDKIIVPSDFISVQIKTRFPFLAPKIVTNHTGINIAEFPNKWRFDRSQTAHSLLYVGRIAPEKGLNYLIEALRIILKEGINLTLKIAGEPMGPMGTSEFCTEINHQLEEVDGHFEFLGWRGRQEISALYQSSTIFIHPAIWEEPFAGTLLESMASGTPTIATQIGGSPELIKDNENGVLIPPKSSLAIAKSVIELLTTPNKLETLGKNGHMTIERHFTIERYVSDLYKVVYNQR